uniref:cytochrome c oxidase subunit III n=1 Tax=Carychium tridentatum TaxID=145635 RepID=UPI0025AA274A|nr:cytochrome c oxidase subunit III [Carychium tridentatum]WIV81384.1 cytochrome c oxidase subunit 3 [Carychium tridentatum]
MSRTPFHLVEFSPWPLFGSIGILCMPLGLIYMIKGGGTWCLFSGVFMTAVVATLWWRDVIRESTFQGLHANIVAIGLKIGVGLFIVSEVCFFFAFFWAYFHSSLSPTIEIGSLWPPIGISPLETFQVPLLNTCVLLLSGVSITWAHHSIEEGNHIQAVQGLAITFLLGVYFLFLQYGEYAETGFSIADSVYGSCFFLATGFHGTHVAVGATFLFVCLYRLMQKHFSKDRHVGFLAAAWYWHFVDVVWLFLYVSIYWWGS